MRWRARAGSMAIMVPLHVPAAGLAAAIAGLRATENLGGFIVTVPHKTAIVPLLDALSEAARCVGAVNAVRRERDGRLRGEILDGVGFVAGLRAAGHEPRGRSAFIAGAGGAGSAIAFALAEAGVARLTLSNRTCERAESLLARLRPLFPAVPLALGDRRCHAVTTSSSTRPRRACRPDDALPVDVASLTPDQLVAEIIMQPEVTPLMAAAAARGCRTHPGLPMLRCQLELMADWMGMRREDGR